MEHRGGFPSHEYRAYLRGPEGIVSTWHDVPLEAGTGWYNFVNEIPKMGTAKLEAATKEDGNPIAQDTKKGELREYPWSIEWNYGFLPQTWEDPKEVHPEAGEAGDDDPIDAVEVGEDALATGAVEPVKVIGALALVDDGELDWKMVCVRHSDPLAARVSDVPDLEREKPGEIDRIRAWFRDYKTPDGKPPNAFAFDGRCLPSDYACAVVSECHNAWSRLISGDRHNSEGHSLARGPL